MNTNRVISYALSLSVLFSSCLMASEKYQSIRDLDIKPGVLKTGDKNSITDVSGVTVGQVTLTNGYEVNTGVTAILPHQGNIFQNKVPAAVSIANAFGKLAGALQVQELGEIETPIILTNTLSVAKGIDGVLTHTLNQKGNEKVRSVNAIVGETNDGKLNDIRRRVVTENHVLDAINKATADKVQQGNVGAGTGTVAFGWKGGIGSSSRVLPKSLGGYTVGVLVQSNYGGNLDIDGLAVGEELNQFYLNKHVDNDTADGSIMIVIATDAPLSDRNLERLANRSFAGLAQTGAAFTNGSGDFAIAFSTAESVRRTAEKSQQVSTFAELPNRKMSPLFVAVAEATREAIYNSLIAAQTVIRKDKSGKVIYQAKGLDEQQVKSLLNKR